MTENILDYYSALKGYAFTLTRNKDDAEDLLHDTYCKAITKANQYQPDTNLKSWLFTIMHNAFINSKRSFYSKSKAELNINHDSPCAPRAEYTIDLKLVYDQIDSMPFSFSTPLKMHVSGYSYQDISDTLKIPMGTVKSRIFMARKRLIQLNQY